MKQFKIELSGSDRRLTIGRGWNEILGCRAIVITVGDRVEGAGESIQFLRSDVKALRRWLKRWLAESAVK